MNKFLIFILFLTLFISSCGSVKEGFSNPKKENSDEFLVEKKSPLVMPPNYDELPMPGNDEIMLEQETDNLELLLLNKNNSDLENENNKTRKLYESILEKIK